MEIKEVRRTQITNGLQLVSKFMSEQINQAEQHDNFAEVLAFRAAQNILENAIEYVKQSRYPVVISDDVNE